MKHSRLTGLDVVISDLLPMLFIFSAFLDYRNVIKAAYIFIYLLYVYIL